MIPSMRSPSPRPSISALPDELVELTLVSAAAGGFPAAIASFSQTCRAFRALVYDSSDQHLWRSVFLTTFDDPRICCTDASWNGCEKSATHGDGDGFDWGVAFRSRLWAVGYIRHCTDPALQSSVKADTSSTTLALETLLSIVHSALPCPPTIVFSFLSQCVSVDTSFSALNAYPVFPPVSNATAPTKVNGSESDARISTCTPSLNIPWFESALERGFPPNVTAQLIGGQMGNVDGVYEERETQAIGRIMCYTGFLPIPEREVEKNMDDVNTGSSFDIRTKEQEKRARRVARMRAYNMRYLSRERHWGPFLPITDPRPEDDSAAGGPVPEDDELLQPILALFADAQMHGVEEEEEEESGEDTEEDTDDDEIGPLGVKDAPRDMTPPSSAQLRPDWAYLGAARVVVEANLQDALHGENSGEIRGLVSLDGLRRGSAPRPVYSDKLDSDTADVVARSGEQTESVNGWDWAGVAGVWRRCVCWLDYRDLILHNLSREFDDPRLQEAVRIVPMRLRIASYSPSSVSEYPDRPTIHVEGETAGSGISGHVRKIRGTVSVLIDGSVRWSLSSTVDGGDADEWVTEGVQVGGLMSGMGVIGMWTGAQHERMDPLGPFWAWKVG